MSERRNVIGAWLAVGMKAKLKAQRLGRIEEATRATSPVPGVRSAMEASAGCHQTRL